MKKANLYRLALLAFGTSVLVATATGCDMQSAISQVLGGLTGA